MQDVDQISMLEQVWGRSDDGEFEIFWDVLYTLCSGRKYLSVVVAVNNK